MDNMTEAAEVSDQESLKEAGKQKNDAGAVRWAEEVLKALRSGADLSDEEAVNAVKEACRSLSGDEETKILGELKNLQAAAEKMIGDRVKDYPIEVCSIRVKNVPYTGKKIKKPSVKVTCGDRTLKEGEDYVVRCGRKDSGIGLHTLKVKGRGKFAGTAEVPFFVVPEPDAAVRMLGGGKKGLSDLLDWKDVKKNLRVQVEYSRDQDFSRSRKKKIRTYRDLRKLFGKLKHGKKYHLRARICVKAGKKKYRSGWSKAMTLKP